MAPDSILNENSELLLPATPSDEEDVDPFNNVQEFTREFYIESKRIWYLAGPVIFTSFCQYALITITQIFSGHLGTIQLAAVSVENSVIAGLPFGMMFGLSSALETYCGQAFGANQYELLGIYMQKSWVLLNATAVAAVPLFIFATPILKFLGQTSSIAKEAGKFSLWMIPQQFAYAAMLPSTKFLQAQSKVVPIAVIAAVVLCLHAFLNWLLVAKLEWGLVGAALVLDIAWWLTGIGQFVYIISGTCGKTWSGFSWKALRGLWRFAKVSIASAVMMCLEVWYMLFLTLFAGYTEDAEISIDAFSICINILGWAYVVAIGLNAASSVRVSNELGSRHPRKARFTVIVSTVTALFIGLCFTVILMTTRKQYPAIFSNNSEVEELVEQLTPLLGISVALTNFQYTLCGVAIGAGWQAPVAYMSIACYFVFGIPLGALMAYKYKMGIKGLWCGMLLGLSLLTVLLLWMVCKTNWKKESYGAEERLTQWRRESETEAETETEQSR